MRTLRGKKEASCQGLHAEYGLAARARDAWRARQRRRERERAAHGPSAHRHAHLHLSTGSAFYFSTYELLKIKFASEGEVCSDVDAAGLLLGRPCSLSLTDALRRTLPQASAGVVGTFMAGGFAGMLNWAIMLPLDTLKTRLQVCCELRGTAAAVGIPAQRGAPGCEHVTHGYVCLGRARGQVQRHP